MSSQLDKSQDTNANPLDVEDDASFNDDIQSYHDMAEDMRETYRIISRSVSNNTDSNVLTRLSTVSRAMSTLTANDMKSFRIDEKDFDLKKILQFMSQKGVQKGIPSTSTDVCFENLSVIGKNGSASVVKTVGDVFLGPLVKLRDKISHRAAMDDLSKLEPTRQIIRNVTGYCESGRMTLVLGRPGAGCSTMLKALSGETQTYLGIEGSVNYSGIPQDEMMKKFKSHVIYNPELDVHFPYLTVEQTIKFAIGCKTPSVCINDVSREQYIQTINDLYLTLYGLKHVEKTLVGNDFVRGISGGQRKRVSIAEAMATRASVYCFDNATRGLDASTALEFAESLRTSTNITQSASIVTIYQASENIYNLFDYVTVLYLGRQIYFGPIGEAVAYFNKMGYQKGARETSAEFLTAVTDPLARVAYEGTENKVPKSADEFEEYWLNSPEYQQVLQTITEKKADYRPHETAGVFTSRHNAEKQKYARSNSKYTVNFMEQLKLCMLRAAKNIVNNKSYTIILLGSSLVQALIIGSLFYNSKNSSIGAFSKGGVIFFALLYFCLMSLAEVASIFESKPILNKQKGYSLFHPSAELASATLVQIPVRGFAILVFTLIFYFLTNLKREAGPFFTFYLFVNLTVICINALFTLTASFCPTLSFASGFTGIIMMASVVYSSFMIQRPSMHWWLKWFSYMNPFLYGFESMITMEFRGRVMECAPTELLPRGSGYQDISFDNQVCAFTGGSLSREMYGTNDVSGEIYLDLAFQYTFDHCWRNLGILIGMILGMLLINCVVVELFNPIVTSSDRLLFVKGAKLPKSLLDATTGGYNDPESSAGSSKIGDENSYESQRATADVTDEQLGSEDIFMWQNVDYVVPYAGEDRKLLNNIQGVVTPGTLTALMGESGAGKTTLLNVLSRRVETGVVTGDMLINGKPIDSSFERRTGYVQQQDLHIAELTVRESLLFAARLRRPASTPDDEKVEYVDKIISILNMNEYADAIAGKSGFGLNVEQRKKLSIATELVAKPSLLLFLDEPTSGLDSQSSWAIVQVLKSLAKAGQAILCTIHQPSAILFEEFDRLLLLKTGGQTVYFGDIGKNSRVVIDYFERQGARVCEDSENPAEYILEAIGAGATATVNENWSDKWLTSPEYVEVTKTIQTLIADTSKLPTDDNSDLTGKYAVSYRKQFIQVLKRTNLQFYRDMDYITSKFTVTLLAGLLTGFSFWNVKHSVIGMQNLMFACFLALVSSVPLTNQIQERAIESRELFEVRESKSRTFHWSCLLISQYLVEIPYSIVSGTVYFICWYFPIQLDNEPSRAGLWWFTQSIFFQFCYVSMALFVVYCSPDLPSANVLVGLLFNIVFPFCGVIQKPSMMPGFWRFLWRTSPYTYFVENMVGILLHDREVHCTPEELNYLNPPSGLTCGEYLADFFSENAGYCSNPEDTSACGVCPYSVGDDYMKTVGMHYSHRWRNIGLYVVYIAFNVFLMLALYYLVRVKRLSISPMKLFSRKK